MKLGLNPYQAAPEAMKSIVALETIVQGSGLEPLLIETRTSQINGSAYCLHMHTCDARAKGESEERPYLVDAWRESLLYSERERAALAWTDALRLIPPTHAPDAVCEEVGRHVDEDE